MWPTWWWPQAFMQPDILISMLAEVVQVVEIVEALLDLLHHGVGAGVGERAEIEPRAGDDVGERADVGLASPSASQLAPHGMQLALRHVREQQVLVVRGAHQAEADAVGEVGDRLHLRGRHVARDRRRGALSATNTAR